MWRNIRDFLGITLGTFLTALGLVVFLIPNKIAGGGVSGFSTILYYLFHFKVGITMLVLNIPLFLFGLKELGFSVGLKTLYGTIMLSVLVDILALFIKIPTHDLLLAAIYGGICYGLGIGIVFKFGGTTGGTDLAARILNKYLKISVGESLFVIDAAVITLAAVVFSVERALYGFLVLLITSKIIDLVQEGRGYAKAALIISGKSSQITEKVMKDLGRGVTFVQGKGAYTGSTRDLLIVIINRSEVSRLKELVAKIDPGAFVVIANVNEALGQGFKDFA
ncbi:YitT family protein [Bacillota bacterium LX-D]|nr:YitT family protein [Bacillota bacterium LX-D]